MEEFKNVISASVFIEAHPKVYEWIDKRIGKFSSLKSCGVFYQNDDRSFCVKLFTNTYQYSILIRNDKIIGGMGNRKLEICALFTGGNDIAGGDYCEETIQKIFDDIISCEFLSTDKFYKSILGNENE